MSSFFGPKTGKAKKQDLRRKITGFSAQMRLETKQNEKTRSSPQSCGDIVLHHSMVSPENDVARGGPPIPQATALLQYHL